MLGKKLSLGHACFNNFDCIKDKVLSTSPVCEAVCIPKKLLGMIASRLIGILQYRFPGEEKQELRRENLPESTFSLYRTQAGS